jgi:hypothetical protein
MFIKKSPIKTCYQEPEEGILIHCDFISRIRIAKPDEGVLQMTVTARKWEEDQYFVRIILSMDQDCLLFSQHQPVETRHYATQIEFSDNAGIECINGLAESGTKVSAYGGKGLKPHPGSDKITFIQLIKEKGKYPSVSGRIHYRAFKQRVIHKPCMEQFQITLR